MCILYYKTLFCSAKCIAISKVKMSFVFMTGWTSSPSPDEELLRAIGDEMTKEILAVSGM